MHSKSMLRIGATLFALMLSQTSIAEGYWGAGGGLTSWNITPQSGLYDLQTGPTVDAVLGLRSTHFAIEGEISASIHDWSSNSDNYDSIANIIVAGLAILPIGQSFEVYAKAGADYWSTNIHANGTSYDGDSGTAFVGGVGARMVLNDIASLRLEYKQVNGISDGLDDGNIGQTTLMVIIRIK
jgi:hypothetical protein